MIDMKPQVAQTWIALKGSEPQPTEKTTQNKAKLPNLVDNENLKHNFLPIYQRHPFHWTETILKHPWPWQQSLVVLDSKKPSWNLLLRSSPKGPEFRNGVNSEQLASMGFHQQ